METNISTPDIADAIRRIEARVIAIEDKVDAMLLYAAQTKNIADMVMTAMSGLEDNPIFKMLGMGGKKDKRKNPIDVG